MEEGEDMEPGELSPLLGKLSRLHQRRAAAEFLKAGITQGQPRILRYLESHEGCIQREICEQCHLEPATITNTLEKMELKGFVERHYEADNRRNQRVFLTPKGRGCLAEVNHIDLLLEDECFTGFSQDEKEAAAGFMVRICRNMIAAEKIYNSERK